jgi:uncharacterized protein with ParB-like and HNH nuclease domain
MKDLSKYGKEERKKERGEPEREKERSERNKPEKKGRRTERKNNEKSKEDLFLLLKNPLISLFLPPCCLKAKCAKLGVNC